MIETMGSTPPHEKYLGDVDGLVRRVEQTRSRASSLKRTSPSEEVAEVAALIEAQKEEAGKLRQEAFPAASTLSADQKDTRDAVLEKGFALTELIKALDVDAERVAGILSATQEITTVEQAGERLSRIEDLNGKIGDELAKPNPDDEVLRALFSQVVLEQNTFNRFVLSRVSASPTQVENESGKSTSSKKEITPENIADAKERIKSSRSVLKPFVKFGLKDFQPGWMKRAALSTADRISQKHAERVAKKEDKTVDSQLRSAITEHSLGQLLKKKDSLSNNEKAYLAAIVVFLSNMEVRDGNIDLTPAKDLAAKIEGDKKPEQTEDYLNKLEEKMPAKSAQVAQSLLRRINEIALKLGESPDKSTTDSKKDETDRDGKKDGKNEAQPPQPTGMKPPTKGTGQPAQPPAAVQSPVAAKDTPIVPPVDATDLGLDKIDPDNLGK